MICNGEKEMCIAGVFGGLRFWCIINSTKNIFIESALFNAVSVRKTAKRHGLNTDASFRYERGVDPNMVIPALIRASQLILELGGGIISSEIFDLYPEKQNDYNFEINFDNVRKMVDLILKIMRLLEILNLLEIQMKRQGKFAK